MAFSVNTNVGAMAALQSLNATNKALSTTQSRINTGMNVASTKDDSAAYTVAQTLRGDLGGLKAVSSSLSRAKSTVDVAVAGAEQISDLMNQMKAKAVEASDEGQDEDSRKALAKDFVALREQIGTIVESSEFNGTNLLKASGGDVKALQSTDTSATTLDVDNIDIETNILDELDTLNADDAAEVFKDTSGTGGAALAEAMADKIDTLSETLNTNLSTLGAASRKIDGQSSFVSKLSDVIESGIGNLVDADLAKESARLQALQVKQQLGVQALSIANQAPQTITSLFR